MKRCFFCHRPLGKNRRDVDCHHVLPKRYFKDYPEEDPNWGNIALSHVSCHRRAHQEYDQPQLDLRAFVAYIEPLDWLFGVYAHPPAPRGGFLHQIRLVIQSIHNPYHHAEKTQQETH